MPTIKITDQLGADISAVSATPDPASALVKYLQGPAADFVFMDDLVTALNDPLASASATPLSLGLNFSDKVTLGNAQPEISIAAGVKQSVNVNAKAGANLFGDDPFGVGIAIDTGTAYLSLALNGSIQVGLPGKDGDLTFGFSAGGGIGAEFFKKFTLSGPKPTVAEALGEVISGFIVPADVSDLDAMKPGDIATVSGNGSFKLNGDVTVSAAPNPLASPNLPLVNQAIQLKAGASLDLAGSFTVSGQYQILVQKLTGNTVTLGYYKKQGDQWDLSATLQASVGANFGKTELIEKLITAISPKPDEEIKKLSSGGLADAEIKQVQDQITASLSHSLAASLKAEFSGSDSRLAAFLYRINTSALDANGSQAVHAALDGDLSGLTRLEKNDQGNGVIAPGITMLRSSLKNVRERKSSFTINLVGLLNFGSVFDLMRNAETVYEPVTGELTINETVKGTSIQTLLLPQAQEQLRKIRFNSLLVTTAYRASHSVSSMQSTSSDVYFVLNANTNEHTISDYLDGMIGVGLLNAEVKRQLMSGFHGTGMSTCLIRVAFSDAACEAMFLNGGIPRAQAEYEALGRSALQILLLPPPGDSLDADRYRRDILASDSIWTKLKALGNPATFGTVPELPHDTVRLAVVGSDYLEVMWWAESMASAAEKLADVRAFVGQADPDTLHNNNTFMKKRDDLQKHLGSVVARSQMHFSLPFGLVALCQAASPNAVPTGLITSPALTKQFALAASAKA
jgi:hypothetical protein